MVGINRKLSPPLPQATTAAASASAKADPRFDQRAAAIRSHPAYVKLSPAGKTKAEGILEFARASNRQSYYLDKLELLLNTPDAPPAETSQAVGNGLTSAVKAKEAEAAKKSDESKWQQALAYMAQQTEEVEALKHTLGFEKLFPAGSDKFVRIDRHDPKDLVVQLKVRVTGEAAQQVKALEDGIEKHLKVPGFTVDLQFTDEPGPDVFEVGADPKIWTNAKNWVGSKENLAHELMHLLGLNDEYDYIESHAGNRYMGMETRLHWFQVQMSRTIPVDAQQGIMANSKMKPLPRQVAEAAQIRFTDSFDPAPRKPQ